ncbi:metal-dependent hydrolase [Aromatoleum petrolei]|uniref:DUF4184 family protein n=1 Tax=Aromatoleum petrolei TaxID=76116 RepID=A0ABX1N0T7_9RHOO|nr:metal-dependent hydrolase [Aromatoleum petrolei]NMF91197.1 hypothetical protein [Aromatoleum petrolei]QTQ35455.1 hypothetical protein ToN1_12910 [Aromatoleum petrolei]
MPFTPLHMGPGILVKAFLQGSFSLMVFGWAQIVMDIQPLVVMITGEGHLHGFSHTYVGATLLAVVSTLTGKYLSELGLKLLGHPEFLPIGWPVAVVSATIGTFSHVLLDSVMHGDVEPFWPVSLANRLHGIISIEALHWLCVGSAVMGAVLYFALAARLARRAAAPRASRP